MSNLRHDFVENLIELQNKQDRKSLSELRGILRGQPRDYFRAGKHVIPFLETFIRDNLPDAEEAHRDRCYYQTGALFAYAGEQIRGVSKVSFGAALRQIRRPPEKEDPLDDRFVALLNCPRANLFAHMRQLIGLIRNAGGATLDWELLLSHAIEWNDAQRKVQERWARDYYKRPPKTSDKTQDDNDTQEQPALKEETDDEN